MRPRPDPVTGPRLASVTTDPSRQHGPTGRARPTDGRNRDGACGGHGRSSCIGDGPRGPAPGGGTAADRRNRRVPRPTPRVGNRSTGSPSSAPGGRSTRRLTPCLRSLRAGPTTDTRSGAARRPHDEVDTVLASVPPSSANGRGTRTTQSPVPVRTTSGGNRETQNNDRTTAQ